MNRPKAVESIGIDLDVYDEEDLRREVCMMQSARKTPTPNELIEEEIETIERMKRDGVVSVHD